MADGNPRILDDATPPGKTSVGSQSVSENDSEQVNETVASRARSVAEKIKNLVTDVRESFASTSKEERVATLHEKTGKILVEIFPVVTWLERRRPPDKAELLKRRIYDVCEFAVECAAHDVPEFAGGGEPKYEGERRSPGWLLLVELATAALHISHFLLDWADEIEVEETAKTSPSLSNVNQRAAADVPAEYRDGGKPDGKPLTVAYVSKPETYKLSGSFLSKQSPKLKTIKQGRSLVYTFVDIARLSAVKTLAENKGH